jgi:hypothetical protein
VTTAAAATGGRGCGSSGRTAAAVTVTYTSCCCHYFPHRFHFSLEVTYLIIIRPKANKSSWIRGKLPENLQ